MGGVVRRRARSRPLSSVAVAPKLLTLIFPSRGMLQSPPEESREARNTQALHNGTTTLHSKRTKITHHAA
jgi:hypothetical protein